MDIGDGGTFGGVCQGLKLEGLEILDALGRAYYGGQEGEQKEHAEGCVSDSDH